MKFLCPEISIGSTGMHRGWGVGGGTTFCPHPEHSRKVSAEKNGSIPHLCAHLLHWLQRRFAAKGSGDPGLGSPHFFSVAEPSLRVCRVMDCKATRRIWTVGHALVPFWEGDEASRRAHNASFRARSGSMKATARLRAQAPVSVSERRGRGGLLVEVVCPADRNGGLPFAPTPLNRMWQPLRRRG